MSNAAFVPAISHQIEVLRHANERLVIGISTRCPFLFKDLSDGVAIF